MALTTMTTSDALRKQVWEEQAYRETLKKSFWMPRFESSDGSNLLYVKTNLEAQGATKQRKGDKLTFPMFPIVDAATYAGVTSGQTLEGKEAQLSWYDYAIELERYRFAISGGTPMDWHRAAFNMPEEAKTAITDWGASKIDQLCFDAALLSPTRVFYKTSSGVTAHATAATAKAALTAADSKLTPSMVSWMKTWAATGGGRSYWPIEPIKYQGKDYYVIVTHADVLYDWREDATVQQAWREAMERGKENPLFSGADYVWDNVIIFSSERIPIAADGGGSTVPWAKGLFMGKKALCWGWGERPSIIEYDKDAKEELYYAWRMTAAVEKPKFNSKDYGSMQFYVSRTNVSGT